MLAIASNARIFLHRTAIDLRKGFEGLCLSVEETFNEAPTSGAYFVFLNRRRNRMKVLYWDNDGFAIWYKRLEKGSFLKRSSDQVILDRRDFFMLLEVVVPKRLQTRFKIG
jgi:transposase